MRRPEKSPDFSAYPNIAVERLDVQDRGSIETAVAATIARFGAIDVLVNNAGYGLYGVFEGLTRAEIDDQLSVNLIGVMDLTREVLPHMRKAGSGVIVNISSGAGVFGLPLTSLYNASKFALEGFSEALTYELEGLGITVKLVEPGGVHDTNFVARAGVGDFAANYPDDYAPFVERTKATFAALSQSRAGATSRDVAEVIFEAATDGTDRLRYLGTSQIKPLVDARRSTSEEEYMALMRASMRPKAD
ncbi:SDR family NAD(P)-dependent oxidoreductase [Martelella endophytica]|uniref:SDR family NAD(P)-dependent oxidoreductase n=1 Tax=Martelella endophytica TaxID=1486262 RepID=UPI000A5576AB|nr:SDR family NAD(P)-dependent oxidoreductase [Martelella endophytica]